MSALTFKEADALLEVRDGLLYWKVARRGLAKGTLAGSPATGGYWKVTVLWRCLAAHRVIWLLSTGEWPSGPLDHINGIRTDNRISNLRPCSASENSRNRGARSKKMNGVKAKGVTFHKQTGKYQASCQKEYIGLFNTEEDAAKAYDAVAGPRFGDFARLNFGATP